MKETAKSHLTFVVVAGVVRPVMNLLMRKKWLGLEKLPAGEYFVKLYEAVKAYASCRHYVFKGLAISVAIHCTIIGVFVLLARSLGTFETVPLNKFFFLVPFTERVHQRPQRIQIFRFQPHRLA